MGTLFECGYPVEGFPEVIAAGVGAVAAKDDDSAILEGGGDLFGLEGAGGDDGDVLEMELSFEISGDEAVSIEGEGYGVAGVGVGDGRSAGEGVNGLVQDGIAGGGWAFNAAAGPDAADVAGVEAAEHGAGAGNPDVFAFAQAEVAAVAGDEGEVIQVTPDFLELVEAFGRDLGHVVAGLEVSAAIDVDALAGDVAGGI